MHSIQSTSISRTPLMRQTASSLFSLSAWVWQRQYEAQQTHLGPFSLLWEAEKLPVAGHRLSTLSQLVPIYQQRWEQSWCVSEPILGNNHVPEAWQLALARFYAKLARQGIQVILICALPVNQLKASIRRVLQAVRLIEQIK